MRIALLAAHRVAQRADAAQAAGPVVEGGDQLRFLKLLHGS
jgi:hypothetical protein